MSPQPIPVRVLLVDDDAMSRELLGILLQGEGYAVESADSGEAALALLRRSEPPLDLVLVDVQMPGIAGTQLARELRRVCGPATVLLAISGSQPPALAVSLFDGFLLKPFKMEQVATTLNARKRQSENIPSGPVSMAASAPKTASRNRIGRMRKPKAHSAESDTAGAGPVLNEDIYRQLAVSMPISQLNEMYAMCVGDARQRIAGMRRLAADHDTARFIREAHAIKGGCGMLGATELHRMAAQLETDGPEGSAASGAQDVNFLDELSAACDRLERMLESLV